MNKDIKLEKTELLNKTYQEMVWLSENFLKITQEIHKINIQKTKKIQIKKNIILIISFSITKKYLKINYNKEEKKIFLLKKILKMF